ncbi:MAG TPA: hypothetical protein VHX42_02950, partial [Candidatus Babeliales bacterium]|nr:hypothetical protein [Candidatus Babeliales bacterium]
MIKNRFFLAFLTLIFASNIHSMKRERETKLSQAQPKSQPFPFTHLPPEMQYKIVTLLGAGSTAQTVEDAGKAINAFAHTNTELKILINDPKICLIIIKNLSKQFKCSDQEATEALQTQEAKERLILQQEFLHICEQEDFDEEKFNTLYGLYQQYVDLNFIFSVGRTEDDPSGIHETLLILGAIKNDCLLIRTLLNHG